MPRGRVILVPGRGGLLSDGEERVDLVHRQVHSESAARVPGRPEVCLTEFGPSDRQKLVERLSCPVREPATGRLTHLVARTEKTRYPLHPLHVARYGGC